jgi:hypothetical protein
VFQNRLARLPEDDLATTVTRDAFVIPFLGLLGYELTYNQRAHEVDGQSFAISHAAGAEDTETRRRGDTEKDASLRVSASPLSASFPPVHVVGARQELGRVPPSGRPRLAPHSLVQEYLNRTEHVWGIVTNGLALRLQVEPGGADVNSDRGRAHGFCSTAWHQRSRRWRIKVSGNAQGERAGGFEQGFSTARRRS